MHADWFTQHFTTSEKIITENAIDTPRIWNCDESGGTPGRDPNGKESQRVYVTLAGAHDAKIGHFLNANAVTILPAVSAA